MSTTITIRNLDEEVKHKLRLRAANHNRSMEAEAREIIRVAVQEDPITPPQTPQEMLERLKQVRGLWKDLGTTDDLMKTTRGED